MKKIASLMLASICLLAFVQPTQALAPRWGWSELEHSPGTARLEAHQTGILDFARLAGPVVNDVTVVSVNLDPKTTKLPGVLSNVWPKVKDALNAVRKVVTGDPTLKASLETKGIAPGRVVGIGEGNDGKLAVFVSNAV